MFRRFRRRLDDMRALTVLVRSAERLCAEMGDGAPGVEHFLLAALEHPDGGARRVFGRLGVTPAATRAAIERQYADALGQAGLDVSVSTDPRDADVPPTVVPAAPSARESGRALLERMADRTGADRFGSARVLDAIADIEHGVAARTLGALGIDVHALRSESAVEIGRTLDRRT